MAVEVIPSLEGIRFLDSRIFFQFCFSCQSHKNIGKSDFNVQGVPFRTEEIQEFFHQKRIRTPGNPQDIGFSYSTPVIVTGPNKAPIQ